MKTFIFFLAFVLDGASVQGQGTVNFANGAAGVNAPVRNGGQPLEDPEWAVELHVEQGGGYRRAAGPVPFQADALAGYFFGGTVEVAGIAPGKTALLKVRVATADGAVEAFSNAVAVVLGGGIMPPANLEELEPLSLMLVALRAQRAGGSISISWPEAFSGFELETSATAAPGSWQTVTLPRQTSGGRVSVTVPAAESVQLFRLRGGAT